MEFKVDDEYTNKHGEAIKVTEVEGDMISYTINDCEGEGTAQKDIFIDEVIHL